jgi:arsenite/tail-anchored protein-transporting ATPase
MLSLGQHRLYFLTGKGGTGKTAISVGLARALARRGKRVLLLEVDAPRPAIPSYFGGQIGYEPIAFAPRIDGANLDFFSALRSYVESVVPAKRLVGLILRNKVVRVFLGSTPGARELVLLSRIWEHSLDPRWDHIVVDLPASGHAVALFRCPYLAARTFERGPLRGRADQIIERFSDPTVAAVLFAALPGEMPINETLETCEAVRQVGLPHIGGVLLNRFPDEEFRPIDEALIDELNADRGSPGNVALAVEAARVTRREQHVAEAGIARLKEQFGDQTAALPVLPGTHSQVADALSLMLAGMVA